MKKILFSIAFMVAIAGAFASKASNKTWDKIGYRQDRLPDACVKVTNVPDNCTTASGIFCGFWNAQGSPVTSTCVDALNHP